MRHFTSIDRSELEQILKSYREPSYRVRQIFQWIYRRGIFSFDEMSDIPLTLRESLKREFSFHFPKILKVLTSVDGTQKFQVQLMDMQLIEAVLIKEKERLTLCISTQVGCRQSCAFCVTGRIGFKRSLLYHEICDQILIISNMLKPQEITNIVIMGMGEPLDNFSQVVYAIKILTDQERFGIHPRRITLSTVGIPPAINELGKEGLGIKLAVSLNAPNDKIRSALMPVNRRFPIHILIKTLKQYPLLPRQKITLEYCLLRGINDTQRCALELATKLNGLKNRIKVNLIPYNSNPLLPFSPSGEGSIARFHKCLTEKGILATVRKSKGGDILAACGQLGCLEK